MRSCLDTDIDPNIDICGLTISNRFYDCMIVRFIFQVQSFHFVPQMIPVLCMFPAYSKC